MKIAAADPMARVLTEDEVRALLAEPIAMHLGMVDAAGWPVVNPVWHVFEGDVFRLVVGTTSHKATVLRAQPRAYFAVDTGATGDVRGVRGRAGVRVIDGDVPFGVAVCRKALIKYRGTDGDAYAEEMLGWARAGDMAVVELTPTIFRAFHY